MKVLLVDDEELALERLRRFLADHPDVEIVGEARDGLEALRAIALLEPDAVFLDVEMPGADGMEVARSMESPRPKVVFCTGYDRYAVRAFELHALDYVLKPVSRERLAQTVERLRRTAADAWDAPVEQVVRTERFGEGRLLARTGAKLKVIAQEEVEYFVADAGTTALHTADARYDVAPSLDALEQRLAPGRFFRSSRSALVRLDAIAEVVPMPGGGELRLRSGARLPVSRRRFPQLLERLEGKE